MSPRKIKVSSQFDRKALYIGRANNLYRRWLAHHRWNQFQSLIITENIQIAWLECYDTNLLPEIEKALIRYF
ncbi:GIY-YIG nuclease family protein [Coleofasciculus sp. FACHB-129]|nr:GIY-YIG nuclease family protein [Coleofasciculus sp. FACHB-129]